MGRTSSLGDRERNANRTIRIKIILKDFRLREIDRRVLVSPNAWAVYKQIVDYRSSIKAKPDIDIPVK